MVRLSPTPARMGKRCSIHDTPLKVALNARRKFLAWNAQRAIVTWRLRPMWKIDDAG